jgi:hypothetical protein
MEHQILGLDSVPEVANRARLNVVRNSNGLRDAIARVMPAMNVAQRTAYARQCRAKAAAVAPPPPPRIRPALVPKSLINRLANGYSPNTSHRNGQLPLGFAFAEMHRQSSDLEHAIEADSDFAKIASWLVMDNGRCNSSQSAAIQRLGINKGCKLKEFTALVASSICHHDRQLKGILSAQLRSDATNGGRLLEEIEVERYDESTMTVGRKECLRVTDLGLAKKSTICMA